MNKWTSEEATRLSKLAIAARYGSESGNPRWFCGRCGHNQTAHGIGINRCKNCDCQAWVHHICQECGEWMLEFFCLNCQKLRRLVELAAIETQRNDPIIQERREQKKWLNEGRETLREIRKYLREKHPSHSQSPTEA